MNQKEIKEKLFIVSSFMDSTLLNENYPMSVYNFCKKNDIEEKTFYKYFVSFDAVKKMIWQSFYDNAISEIMVDEGVSIASEFFTQYLDESVIAEALSEAYN